jgi:hypothetical protein
MVVFLYSNKEVEYQAIACIKSFESKITDDVKIVYYTIGFESSFNCKNLHKIKIDYKPYPTFHYYKAELSLLTLALFPNENYFAFSDTDIIYSNRFNFDFIKKDTNTVLAPIGPHEYPYLFEYQNGIYHQYNEVPLMEYLNVPSRTMWYAWSCFYLFNHSSSDFLKEYTSLCKNEYLLEKRKMYYPFHDETSFNVCLWKHGVVDNLGFCFVNTHILDTVEKCEYGNVSNYHGKHLDLMGNTWEYIKNPNDVMFYHGIKSHSDIESILNLILNKKKNETI